MAGENIDTISPRDDSFLDWHPFGRQDLSSLRQLGQRSKQLVTSPGSPFAVAMQLLTSPVRGTVRVFQGRSLDGVGVRPTEVFDSWENTAQTALALIPVGRAAYGVTQSARGFLATRAALNTPKAIRATLAAQRALARSESYVSPAAIYAGKTLHAVTSPMRLLARSLFPGLPKASPGSMTEVLSDLAYATAEYPLLHATVDLVSDEFDAKNKEEADRSRGTASAGAGEAMAAQQRAEQTNTVSVAESLQRGTDAWILADAQAKLRAAGPTNEAAVAEYNDRVRPIRNAAFRRKYAEWNNGADIDFELRVLRDRPDHEKAGEIRARHEEAKRMFGLLKPEDWIPKEGGM